MPPVAASVCEYTVPTVPLGRGEAVVMLSGGAVELMVSVMPFDMVAAAASFSTIVKVKLPALVGVPLINPVDEFRLRPAGSDPPLTEKL